MPHSTSYILHSTLKCKFYILHFTFYILLAFAMMSCTKSTSPKTGSLSGRVILVNDTDDPSLDPVDFSGVTVALYELAVLDTTILRINQEYPQIGVLVSQETEFDHRLQNPVKVVTTDAIGSYSFSRIPYGRYNFAIIRDGWGLRYEYNILIDDSSKQQGGRITGETSLYPTRYLNTVEQGYLEFFPDRSYIVAEDVTVLADCRFNGGSNLFIAPGRSLNFHGDLHYDSSISTITRISSSDGLYSTTMKTSIEPFNRVMFSNDQEPVLSHLVIDHGVDGIRFQGGGTLKNSIVRVMTASGVTAGTGMFNAENMVVRGNNTIGLLTQADGTIQSSIFLGNGEGLFISEAMVNANNNYIVNNRIGVRSLYGASTINNNCFDRNVFGLSICAADPSVTLNSFYANSTDIELNKSWVSYQVYQYCSPTIESNNFLGSGLYISLYGKNIIGGSSATQGIGVISNQHYPNNYYTASDLMMHLFDSNYPGSNIQYSIDYLPRRISINPSAGIQ